MLLGKTFGVENVNTFCNSFSTSSEIQRFQIGVAFVTLSIFTNKTIPFNIMCQLNILFAVK